LRYYRSFSGGLFGGLCCGNLFRYLPGYFGGNLLLHCRRVCRLCGIFL
jgi:hypothetical protein